MSSRPLRFAGVVLAAAVLMLGPTGAAHADESEDTGVSVTIPDVDPTDEPTEEPTDEPTDEPTSGTGGGNGGSGGSGDPGDNPPDDDAPTPPSVDGGPDGSGDPDPDGAGGDPTPSGSTDCVPEKPAVPTEPSTDGDVAGLDRDVYLTGQQVTATADGFGRGEQVQLVLFAEPQVVSTLRADARGAVEAVFTVSEETASGPHTLQLTGWCGDIALASVLVGSTGDGAAGGSVPAWAWWVGGGLGLAGVGVGGWYVFRAMRAPGAGLPVVGGAEVAA